MIMSLSSINLDAFLACAQTGNFTRAAEKIHITQSALSQRVQNLESELGTSLFIRDRSGIRLTEQGSELLRYCQAKAAIETEVVDRIMGAASGELTGVIRIGGFSSVMRSVVLPALAPLLEQHARVKLELVSRELEELPELLKTGEIDYMILDKNFNREDIEAVHLGDEVNVLVQKKGYKGPEIYLDHHEKDEITFKYLKLRSTERAAKIDRRYLDDVYGLLDGVKLGLGRAVLPLHLVRGEKGLAVVEKDRALKIPVVLHHYVRPFYSKLHIEVVDILNKHTSKYLS
jgi:DNA-binding transcriptional LysR family regulator